VEKCNRSTVDAFGLPFRDPFEFIDTNNATEAMMDKPKTMEFGRKRALSSFKK
jgi:hypothetical protein